jgi:hypothetical protein
MPCNSILIIIDPWERHLIAKILFFLDDQYRLFKRIEKFIKKNRDSIHTVVLAAYDGISVHKTVQNLPGNKIHATTIEEIAQLVNDNNIENIYLAGSAWEQCVRHRELGYLNLRKQFKNINILVKDDCVIYSEHYNAKIFDPQDNLDWVETNTPGIFKYAR